MHERVRVVDTTGTAIDLGHERIGRRIHALCPPPIEDVAHPRAGRRPNMHQNEGPAQIRVHEIGDSVPGDPGIASEKHRPQTITPVLTKSSAHAETSKPP